MKRNGYTIAEALITLAVVGIVAALTIPAFIANYRKNIFASSLSAAVSKFDNAMSTMMMKEGVYDLLDTEAWKEIKDGKGVYSLNNASTTIDKFKNKIDKTLPIATYTRDVQNYSKLSNPSAAANVSYNSPVRFKTKNGVEYMIYIDGVSKAAQKKIESDILKDGGNYLNKAADVYIDVNGSKEPNIQGRDWFLFELGNDGHLYPYGGKDHDVLNGKTSDPKKECVENKNGYYCGAYLMENGYKMDY